MTVNIALRRTMAQLNYFTEGNIPEALISCPQDWRPSQIREMQEIFDDMLRGDLAQRSGAKFVPGGLSVQFTKDALLKDDFDEWLARVVCFAFSLLADRLREADQPGDGRDSSPGDGDCTEGLVAAAALGEGAAGPRCWRTISGSPRSSSQWNDDRSLVSTTLSARTQVQAKGKITSHLS